MRRYVVLGMGQEHASSSRPLNGKANRTWCGDGRRKVSRSEEDAGGTERKAGTKLAECESEKKPPPMQKLAAVYGMKQCFVAHRMFGEGKR